MRTTDNETVIHRVLVLTSFVCCGLVVASFALFARAQLSGASKHQVHEIASSVPGPAGAPMSHHEAQPRRFIDGAASALTTPFRSIVQSDNQWVVHGLPLIFALLVYGAGIGYLARYTSGLS